MPSATTAESSDSMAASRAMVKRGGNYVAGQLQIDRGQAGGGQRVGNAAEAAADGVDVEMQQMT